MAETRDPFDLHGTLIGGKYRVGEVVGEGGFGVVYRGIHEGFEAPIAIKCLKLPAHFDADAQTALVRQLREEGRLLLKLSQKTSGIVQALDVGSHTTPSGVSIPYLVLEWLDGRSLADELRARRGKRPYTTLEALRLLSPAANALSIAHAENIAHRDIKPDNLFVVGEGKSRTMKLLDFGIAKVLAEATSAKDASTSAQAPMFTPGYAAPEQYEKKRGASGPWTDVFALAVVFVELASGRKAIAGGELFDIFRATVDPSVRPTLRTLSIPTSDAVEAVLDKALHIEPRGRYENAALFWAALEEAVNESKESGARAIDNGDADLSELSTGDFALAAGLDSIVDVTAKTSSIATNQDLATAPTYRATTRSGLATPVSADSATFIPISPRSPGPSRRLVLGAGGFAILAGLVGIAVSFARPTRDGAPNTAGSAPRDGGPPASSALPGSTNAEASSLFKEALEAWRDGSPDTAVHTMEQAAKLDRGFAAAQLRLSLWKLTRKPAEARDHYDLASRHADSLGAKDKRLLDSTAPMMGSSPDGEGFANRLSALVIDYPDDVELRVLLGSARLRQLRFDDALTVLDRASVLDPGSVGAWVLKAEAHAARGQKDEQLADYTSCLANAPRAFECLNKQVGLRSSRGECKAMLEDAKRLLSMNTKVSGSHRLLAIALLATGAPRESALEALRTSWSLRESHGRETAELSDRTALAVLDGDFDGALALVDKWSKAVAAEPDQSAHAGPVIEAASIYRELGDTTHEALAVDDFLKRRDLWTDPSDGDWTLTMRSHQLLGGALAKPAFDAERAEWMRKVRSKWESTGRKIDKELDFTQWTVGYATIVTDAASAKDALSALPSGPLPPSSARWAGLDLGLGKVYALDGKPEDAIAPLRRVASSCSSLGDPIANTSAHFYLAVALERAGKPDDAKGEYEVVLSRWGKASRSKTAKEARDRLGKLATKTP